MFSLFQKTKKIVIYNEAQKDEFIEKLEKENVSLQMALTFTLGFAGMNKKTES